MMKVAKKFQCNELVTIGQNILRNQSDLNPSIGTYLNDKSGEVAKSVFLFKKNLADANLAIPGSPNTIPVHKSLKPVRDL